MKIIYNQNCDSLWIELRPGTVWVTRPEPPGQRTYFDRPDEHGAPGAIHIDHAAANITEPGTIEFRKIITL
jgi:hypothetical protein